MASALRKTAINPVGDMPWGTHFCVFYETNDDLVETLVPYFKIGLENNEYCLWVIPVHITEVEARGALARAIPNFDRCLAEGRIEILSEREWYLEDDKFDPKRVMDGWHSKLREALAKGHEGIRVSGSAFWVTANQWTEFCQYEREINNSVAGHAMILLCTYSLLESRALDVLDVAGAHQFTLARRQGEWEVIETPELKQAKQEIKKLNEELEGRVTERTQQLSQVTGQLKAQIAERSRAERALADAQAELERAARLTTLGVLAASIAHEVNQPLAAIVTNSEASLRWLANDAPNLKEATDALKRIDRDANRASHAIQRIRALIKEDKTEYVELNVSDIIDDVLALARGASRHHHVALRAELAGSTPAVLGDRMQLQQLIMNLVVNGIEATAMITGRKREVVVRSGVTDAVGLFVAVEDTGIGLDPATSDRLFDPFFTTKPNGMGMGLSISRSIAESHGGSLTASTKSPHGTVFRFTLPSRLGGAR
jgi:C4-dicarboxylate-specific signal transduction histidine kinase